MTKFATMVKGMHKAFHEAMREFAKTEGLTQAQLLEATAQLAAFHKCMDNAGQSCYAEFERLEAAKLTSGFVYRVPYDEALHAFPGSTEEFQEILDKAGHEIFGVRPVQFQGHDRFLHVFQKERGLQAPFTFEGTRRQFTQFCAEHEFKAKVVDLVYIPE